ncbi:MAG: AAA family ATPase [Candidatus Roizmanbacteria bacterium]|nr:AAA family ATPase [Candidatus Roizmanbacteria bacterium]
MNNKFDPILNPFSPGAGSPPPELAGRSEILDRAALALARIKARRPEKSFFLVGLRGVGKTVLLHRIEEMATEGGYKAIMIEAREDKKFSDLLIPYLRKILFSLDSGEMISEKVKRAFKVFKSFALKINTGGSFELGIDIDPERGTADSGDLEIDLAELFIALGEAALDRSTAISIIIDEIQYLSDEELSSLIMAVHKITQKSLPLIVIGAGLPQFLGKAGNAKSYAERLFDYPEVGPLGDKDAALALQEPVEEQGITFTAEAIKEILHVTEKYPYFLQEWGYQSWLSSTESPISLEIIQNATQSAITRLDKNFFRVRFDRLTPREKEYLRAMAELGAGPHRSGDIAALLGLEVQSVAPFRSSLINKGMIYSPAHGDTAFTVPLFVDFMKRTMPFEKR